MKMAMAKENLDKKYHQAIKLFKNGRMEKSATICRKILQKRPEDAATHHLLSSILYQNGDPVQALQHAQKAAEYQGDSVNYLSTCAQIQKEMGLHQGAIATLEQALKLEPESPDLLSSLAEILHLTGNVQQAMKIVKFALSVSPQNPRLLVQAGDVFYKIGETKAALSSFKLAISVDPNSDVAYLKSGIVWQSLGEYKSAEDCFNMAMELNPDGVLPFVLLARQNKSTADDPKFAQLERLKNKKQMPLLDQIHIRFALGKMYTDCKQYDSSFANYLEGNSFRDKSANSSLVLRDFEKEVNTLAEVCSEDFFSQRQDWGDPTDLPVFIVGMPRSGTTLVETILDCHPQVHGAGELPYIPSLLQGFYNQAAPENQADKIKSLACEVISQTAQSYCQHLQALSPASTRIIDKLPKNFMHVWIISLMFPNAKIIHCKRNPLDTCLSCFFADFDGSHAYTNDLKSLGKYYNLYEKIIGHWQQTSAAKILEVQYEDLVLDQEATSRKMIDFLDLDWNSTCLDFQKNRRSVLTASNTQVGKKIYSSSIDRWRHYEKHLGPLLAELS